MSEIPRLLEPEQLVTLLEQQGILIVHLASEAHYQHAHIPGAIHFDPARLMSGTPPASGKLPELTRLEQIFSEIGLTPDIHVVVYDDEGGAWAGRLVWTLDVIGHPKWSYLNGGFIAWRKEGFPVTSKSFYPQSCEVRVAIHREPVAEVEDILESLDRGDGKIWDARTIEEYLGTRVLAQKGGHIPGAIHCEWMELMDPASNMRIRQDALDYLAAKGFHPEDKIITHCQSHRRSSYTYMVARILGFSQISGYHGSWSEWGNLPDTPVEVG